jgi:prefoldin alpha subunit
MNEKELQIKFQIFEQQIMYIQEQISLIEQTITDLSLLKEGLDKIREKEIFAPIGRGIFVKAKIISDNLLVDIGDKNLIEKNIPETKKLIKEQIEKLGKNREMLESELKKLDEEIKEVFLNSQKKHEKCGCDDECNCENKKSCESN